MSKLDLPQAAPIEESIVGCLLGNPKRCSEIMTILLPDHFGSPAMRMLFDGLRNAYFDDTPIDPITIGQPIARQLAAMWQAPENEVVPRVQALATAQALSTPSLRDHAALVRRTADRRAIMLLAAAAGAEAAKDDISPEAIAGEISTRALAIASDTLVAQEITDFGEEGRDFLRTMRYEMQAAAQGVELGAMSGLTAIDEYTRGMRPGRLYMVGGEPGSGKSGVYWRVGLNYAIAQAKRPEKERMATLIISMEMGKQDSNGRFAQTLAGIDGRAIQQATLSTTELAKITEEWARKKDIPLYLSYPPTMRASAIQALVAESIRRHNVGLVIIDHFRMWDLDRRLESKNDEDEEKVRFLKERLARAMNVAVVCLAHTRKPDAGRQGGRPQMADLRGSGQIAAHADMVSFVYRPVMYASQEDIDSGKVDENQAEIIHRKNRQGPLGTGYLYFDPSVMDIH